MENRPLFHKANDGFRAQMESYLQEADFHKGGFEGPAFSSKAARLRQLRAAERCAEMLVRRGA